MKPLLGGCADLLKALLAIRLSFAKWRWNTLNACANEISMLLGIEEAWGTTKHHTCKCDKKFYCVHLNAMGMHVCCAHP